MKEYQSLSHTKWDCKYHVVFVPKRRRKKIFGALRKELVKIFHELARHKESQIVEGHLMADHIWAPRKTSRIKYTLQHLSDSRHAMKPSAIKHDLFAADKRRVKLDRLGDPLTALDAHIDFAALAAEVDRVTPRPVFPDT